MPTPAPGTSFNIGSLLKNLNPLTQYAVRNPPWNRGGPTLKPSSAPGLSGMAILDEVPGVLERGGDAARKFYELGKGVIERRPWNEVRNNFMQPTEFKNTGIMQNLADRAANEIIYSGKEALSGHIPYTSRGVSSLPPGYTHDELVLAAKARASQIGTNREGSAGGGSIGGGNMGGYVPFGGSAGQTLMAPGSPAADRAYASELSSVAQQAAQNPMLQQYQDLRTSDPAAAQDLGMRIWAEKHRGLAEKVKPGQSGYDVIQQVLAGQTPGSQAKVPGVVSQPWAEGVVSVGDATRAGLPLTSDQSIYSAIPEISEEEMRKIMFNYRPE